MKKSVAMPSLGGIMRAMCRVAQAKDCYSKVVILFAALVIMCGIFVSCGGEEDVIPAEVSGDLAVPSPLTGEGQGEGDYTGKIVIKFKDGTSVRLDTENQMGPFVTRRTDSPREAYEVRRVNEVMSRPCVIASEAKQSSESNCANGIASAKGLAMTRIANITRVMEEPEEDVERWVNRLKGEGKEVKDWNLYYYLDVPEYEDARELVKELNGIAPSPLPSPSRGEGEGGGGSVIEYAEIIPIFQLAEVLGPDMSGEQGYLKSAAQGGLGIEDVWAQGIYGQNTMVIDQEYDWNFDHEILPIDETKESLLNPDIETWLYPNPVWIGKNISGNIEHGTAVVGIIAAQGNDIGKGIKGIAPDTVMTVGSIDLGDGLMGAGPIPPIAEDVPGEKKSWAGTVLTIEVQRKGITTTGTCDVGDGVNSPIVTGCVPLEASKFVFDVIQLGVTKGKVIIEGSGNGGVNLNDNNAAKPKDGTYSYFNDNDSGAIMVGASLGADKRKAAWSNCGGRVDVFAWGQGVVTSGYGDKFCVEGAGGKPCADPDNPTKYTGQFGGTSAATAQIAGVAALVQSYVRQLFFDAGFNGKTIFLDSKQMRTILKNSGQSAVYGQTPNDPNPNCNIGVQPDAAQALVTALNFIDGLTLPVVPLNKYVVSGIRYDMDGDKRAELISFSRDHKWYIDLSSVGNGADNFGEWDIIIPSPLGGEGQGEGENTMLFPVVHDYNSDGRADLALYDSINGKWYIKYTTSTLILGLSKDEPIEWDRVIDYSTDPAWKPYSRPVPGDYNGDYWLDLALQTPDGHWLIDYGGFNGVQVTVIPADAGISSLQYLDKFGSFEKDVKYLTDEQLTQAPGWAWLPVITDPGQAKPKTGIVVKIPDTLPNAGKLLVGAWDENLQLYFDDELLAWMQPIFGDNSTIVMAMNYNPYSINLKSNDLGVKTTEGNWGFSYNGDWGVSEPLDELSPNGGVYGDVLCRPIPADYDGDGKDDRAVQCGTTWRVAYSSTNQLHEFELDQALDPLPAYVYAGGMKYQDTIDLYNYYNHQINCPPQQVCDVFDAPPPVGPYFIECVKYWAPKASYCWNK